MSRRRPHEPYVQIKVNLPATLNALLEEQLWDPVLKKPRYAERSALFTQLITQWLESKGVQTGALTR